MPDLEVRAPDVDALVRRIKAHADGKALRRELMRGLNRATKGVRDDMRASIAPSLPSRGGLASLVQAGTSLSTRARSGMTAGVSIRGRHKSHDLARMNAGVVRHPTYGHGPWVNQTAGVDPHFLDESFEKSAPDVRRDIVRVMEDIARKVEG